MLVIEKVSVVTTNNQVLYEAKHEPGMWIPRVNDTICLSAENLWHVKYVVWVMFNNSLDVIVVPELGLLE